MISITFSERLTRAMDALGVTNAALASALNVDPSSISRIRTGARGMPKPHVSRKIAQYLISCCGEGSQAELYELTKDPRLLQVLPKEDIIMLLDKWLQVQAYPPNANVGKAARGLEVFSPLPATVKVNAARSEAGEASLLKIYRGNAGKRQALLDCIANIIEKGARCAIKVFTDEDLSWLTEDAGYSRRITGLLMQLAQSGCRFEHIRPPITHLENSLNAVERWLPVFMSGAVSQFYYPFARDAIHRRTLIVVDGVSAMCSMSVAGQTECLELVFTEDPGSVKACSHEFDMILSLCRQCTHAYTRQNHKAMCACLRRIEEANADGIFKSCGLSSVTMPPELVERFSFGKNSLSRGIFASLKERIALRQTVLRQHVIVDIMQLSPVEDVIAGKVMITNTESLPDGPNYYTPEEYALHVKNILHCLDKYPNYRAVLTDEPLWKDVIALTKQNEYTLLIKKAQPVVIYEVTDQPMADSIWDYMKRYADGFMDDGARGATKERLKDCLRRLYTVMK